MDLKQYNKDNFIDIGVRSEYIPLSECITQNACGSEQLKKDIEITKKHIDKIEKEKKLIESSKINFVNKQKVLEELDESLNLYKRLLNKYIETQKEEYEYLKGELEKQEKYDKLFNSFFDSILFELQKDLGQIEKRYISTIKEYVESVISREINRVCSFKNCDKEIKNWEEKEINELFDNIKDEILLHTLCVITSLRNEEIENNLYFDNSVPINEKSSVAETFKETLFNLFKGE